MSAKKVCCLVTITAMLFFGLPAVPFANVDRAPKFSQEELGLVFQNAKSTWKEKPDFLKYLDEQEMKETKGKAVQVPVVIGTSLIGGAGAAAISISNDIMAGGLGNIDWGQASVAFATGAVGTAVTLLSPSAWGWAATQGAVAAWGTSISGQTLLAPSPGPGGQSGGGGSCGGCHK